MKIALTYLHGGVPMIKQFEKMANGTITQISYPMISKVTSEVDEVETLNDMYKSLSKHMRGQCLLKGELDRPLQDESRRQMCRPDTRTQVLVLDLDKAPFTHPDEFMKAIGLETVSYIWQWSSSAKLIKSKAISGHIFMLLSAPVHPQQIKAWLMHLNLTKEVLKRAITLSASKAALHWPLDIIVNDNGRIIYISPPKFKSLPDPILPTERFIYIKSLDPVLDISLIKSPPLEKLKEIQREFINTLRTDEGIKPLKSKLKMIGEFEVQTGVGEVSTYEVIDNGGEFIRYNLNGGNSQAYWHPRHQPDLLHSFKGEPSLLIKEIMPGRYAELVRVGKTQDLTPDTQGDVTIAFRDKVTAEYWKGTWNGAEHSLEIYTVSSKDQLHDFLSSRSKPIPPFVPEWELVFQPHNKRVYDEKKKIINQFIETPLMRTNAPGKFPLIQRIIDHAIGTGAIQEHFLNWLAVILQHRRKTGTAWILHGTEGCLAGDTQITFRRGNRSAGRPLTIKSAYEKWTGTFKQGTGIGKTWDMSLPTYALSVRNELTVGYHEVAKIVKSGVKMLYRVTADDGSTIRVTHEHPFMRLDGSFTKLCDLKIGDSVLVRGNKNDHIARPLGRKKQRTTIHSIRHHPFAWQHMIGGVDYKRAHKARLVVEAHMNHLSFVEFVYILRHDPVTAAKLKYLSNDVIVHHIDEDCANDAFDNLAVIEKFNHDQHHAKTTGLGTVRTVEVRITAIVQDKEEMTYDMTMKAPYHNYVANNFCVSNTGKGLLLNHALKPILGKYLVTKKASEMKSEFNGWMETALLVFIDEIEADAFERKSMEGDLRNAITEPTFSIRRMRVDSYERKSYANFIFSSNKKQPVRLPTRDRRFNVAVYQPEQIIITAAEVDKGIPKELEAFATYILTRAADIDKASHIMHTEDRATIQALNITAVEEFADHLLKGNLNKLWEYMPDERALNEHGITDVAASAYASMLKRFIGEPESNISRDQLVLLFQHAIGELPSMHGANKFTSFLRHQGITTKKIWCDGVATMGIQVKWQIDELKKKEIEKSLTKKLTKLRRA